MRIMHGDFKKLEGDVLEVDTKRRRIQIQGVTTTKADGTQVPMPVVPSSVALIKLISDKERDRVLERRSKGGEERTK